uniref:solute carrier family 2, facilitated glucose transporter member 5 isoform X1 n=1 Tax=Ciona intestinalis TaxID=7719 RepID=UPI000EF470BB|nr:solute carrier family 2, facilitated glucose transporter member 5 isoform X1 [Ciona intestinalis]|eukprot:XP_026690625.1 solute carrier family 2, facilitated glucose transporter member 5 isoform X1 [Ciona intestinalis]
MNKKKLDSSQERYGNPLSIETEELLWVLTETFFPLGGVFGSMLVRPLLSRLGPRKSMIYTQILSIISTLLTSLSVLMRSYEAIIIGRFFLGAYCSIGIGIGPIYVSEISSPVVRGPVGGMFGVAIGIGTVVGNALGLKEVLGTKSGWPYLFALTVVPTLVFLSYIKWIPDSPRYTLMTCKDEAMTRHILTKLRGTDDVDKELDDLKVLADDVTTVKILTVKQVLTSRSLRWQLACTTVVLASVQLTGINGVQFNLNTVFLTAGIPHSIVSYVSLGVVAAQVVVASTSSLASERFGRRTLILAGNLIIVMSTILYTVSLALYDQAEWLSYVSIVATLGFILGVNIGPGIVAYVMGPELNNQSARPGVMTVAVFCFWLSFTIVTFATPYMFLYLGSYVLLPFMTVAIATVLFVYKFVPETKGRSMEEIEDFFKSGNTSRRPSAIAFVNRSFSENEINNITVL